jgi:peptidoglycan/xylan/chitin deacetylase (PgdA/CDA1 family)
MRRIYRTLFNPFGRRTPKRPVIFMYHRVARLQYDPWGLAVDPERFDAQMHWLASERRVLPLHDFVDRLGAGDLPNNSAAITFDDGYVDNLHNALPAIRRHGLCATVFVVGGAIGRSEGFWWDELGGLILESRSKLDASVTIGNQTISLRWPAGSNRPGEGPLWRAWKRPSQAREVAYASAWQALRDASSEARLKGMREIRMLLPPVDMERDRAMNVGELSELTAGGTFTLGGHSMTHPALPALATDTLREELADSLAVCRSVSPSERYGFAYPYGDLDDRVHGEVLASGFAWACTTRSDFVDRKKFDLFALPRLGVGDWQPERLAAFLQTSGNGKID